MTKQDNMKQGFYCSTKDECKYNPNCEYFKNFNFIQERLNIEKKNREIIIKKWFECYETFEEITKLCLKVCEDTNCHSDCESCFVDEIQRKSNEIIEKNKKDFESLKKTRKIIMTDKEIIEDGVNVTGCIFNNQNIKYNCENLHNKTHKCKNYNCMYKQLQREKQTSQEARDTAIKEFNRAETLNSLLQQKEQECIILDNDCQTKFNTILKLEDEVNNLRSENTKLKAKLDEYEKYGGIIHEGQLWASEAMESRNKLRCYDQVLKEIKEHCLKCTNEKFTLQDFLNAKDEELTEKGQSERDILKIATKVDMLCSNSDIVAYE